MVSVLEHDKIIITNDQLIVKQGVGVLANRALMRLAILARRRR